MRALLCVLLAVGVVFAQGKKKPVFDVPDPKAPEAAHPDQRRADALQRTIQRLAGWPSPRARRAAEQLIVQKEKSLPLVVSVLVSADPKEASLKPGAAYVVGRIGAKEHLLTLLLVAAEKEQHRQADVFLEAALRLDRQAAVAEAFRFFHLAETTLRREATKFVLNNVAAENLPQVLELLDRRKAERSFTREIGLRLLDRLVAAKQVEWSARDKRGEEVGAGQYFYGALGDESPQVASRAMRLLAGRNEPDNVAALNRLIAKERSYWRQRSYAALALSLLSAAFRVQALEPQTIDVLRGPKGLGHPKETLARASAALALAQTALRGNDRELVRLLDREIPIILIDAVGASRHHYRDFGSVMPLAYAMLRRITGQNFPDHAPRWAKWWKDHGRLFRAKRELIEVRAEDLPDVEVEVHAPQDVDGKRVRFSVVGRRRPSFQYGRAYALPREEMEAFLAHLSADGFFDTPETDQAALDGAAALVVMRIGDLTRKVAYEAGEGKSARRNAVLARARRLVEEYGWQRWWDIDTQPSWELFFIENLKWFKEQPDRAERAARLRTMVAGSLNDLLTVEERVEAVRYLAALPGGGGALDDRQLAALLKAAAAERETNEFLGAVTDLLVPAAGTRASGPLIDILADRINPNAKLLLARICRALAADEVARLVSDPRWNVRRAAVAALGKSGGEAARPVLEAALEDKEVLVRVEAAEALARRKDPVVLETLGELASSQLPAVRAAAAYGYGVLGTEEARQAVGGLLYGDRNPEVRIRAISGLVDSGEMESALALVGVFRSENDVRVRAAAARGIVSLESPALVEKLIERLQLTDAMEPERVALVYVLAQFASDEPVKILRAVLHGDDPLSADAAALGLARRWDGAALIQLIKMIRRGNNTRTAVRHLQLLTSHAFEVASYKEQADNYTGWARTHTDQTPWLWFRDALERRAYDALPLKSWAEASELALVPDGAVPLLLRALRDSDWFIQRNASFLLSRRIGDGSPAVITYSASREEVEAAIRAYHDWWNQLQEKAKAEKQG